MSKLNSKSEFIYTMIGGLIGILMLASLLVGSFFLVNYLYRHYELWSVNIKGEQEIIRQTQLGKAILAKSENEKLARVEQAKAELMAAKMTAEAIEIVGMASEKYPSYRQQEFILGFTDALKSGSISQIVYVPTEAMIPITEASRAK